MFCHRTIVEKSETETNFPQYYCANICINVDFFCCKNMIEKPPYIVIFIMFRSFSYLIFIGCPGAEHCREIVSLFTIFHQCGGTLTDAPSVRNAGSNGFLLIEIWDFNKFDKITLTLGCRTGYNTSIPSVHYLYLCSYFFLSKHFSLVI